MAEVRKRSLHPGVKLRKPNRAQRRSSWQGRYRDPDTGKLKDERIDPELFATAERRLEWAILKSRWLQAREAEPKSPKPKAVLDMTVRELLEEVFAFVESRRPR